MTYPLNKKEYQSTLRLSPNDRYLHFIARVVEWQQVWGLSSAKGWVVLSSDGDECFPVWPHPDYAAAWATDDWSDCWPEAVDLDTWLERWTPGMEEDGTLVAVFPKDDEESIVVSPADLKTSLLEEMGDIKH
jgi:hypothetical protein